MNRFFFYLFVVLLTSCAADTPTNQVISDSTQTVNIIAPTATLEVDKIDGRKLFIVHCASCHSSDQINNLIGPALGGITSRKSKEWIYSFTRSSQTLIFENKDTAALAIAEAWNNTAMTSFPFLTDTDLDSLYAYIEAQYKINKPIIRMRRIWLE